MRSSTNDSLTLKRRRDFRIALIVLLASGEFLARRETGSSGGHRSRRGDRPGIRRRIPAYRVAAWI